MSHPEQPTELSTEDRLKAIGYQFVSLYERWSEDRHVAAKQGADLADMLKAFSEQVKKFKSLEPEVRNQINASIHSAAKTAVETVGKEAVKSTARIADDLRNTVARTENVLNQHRQERATNL